MQLAAVGMLVAVVGTLLRLTRSSATPGSCSGLIIGSVIGAAMSIWMPMTAIPQRTAISHAFGALAATLVGIAHYDYLTRIAERAGRPRRDGRTRLRGDVRLADDHRQLDGLRQAARSCCPARRSPITCQNAIEHRPVRRGGAAVLVPGLAPSDDATHSVVFYLMVLVGLAVGVLIVLPIGGADMPVVISLLNSYAGLASSATGLCAGQQRADHRRRARRRRGLLALDPDEQGDEPLVHQRAVRRVWRRQRPRPAQPVGRRAHRCAASRSRTPPCSWPMPASVIVVPGYGMAVAQAQHQVRELAELIEKRGGEVKYAIHPVAGRMPGHMNVLLAEANVPYDKLFDMDEINDEFRRTDVALVIGANDVVNPAARNDPSSPIYGMPILNADQAQSVIVLKRSMNPGFAGIENELYAGTEKLCFATGKSGD